MRSALRSLDLVFALSGAAALVYELVWARELARLCGGDAAGFALVLALFMGGLGLGAQLAGAAAARSRRPERAFALLELFVGLWAAATPLAFARIAPIAEPVGRVAVAALLLLPPTVAMGATFPWMARLALARREQTMGATGSFYGANTLGAAMGALLGPCALLPLFGLAGALRAAAGMDFLAAAGAWLLLRGPERALVSRTAPVGVPGAAPVGRSEPERGAGRALLATALLGFAGLALEVLLARLLVEATGASIYALAIVLAVFLAGLGLGARHAARGFRAAPDELLARAALWLPLATCAGLVALRWQLGEGDLFGSLANRMPQGASLARLWLAHALFAALALLAPASLLGFALPAAAALAAQRRADLAPERALARVYFANTLGALAGSACAGFVLLPRLGLRGALAVVLGLPFLAALAARPRARALGLALLVALPLGAWALRPGTRARGVELLWLGSDAVATVAVEEEPGPPRVRSLRVNGKPVASTAAVDLRLQRLLGHVPGLLHGEVESALVVGLGTGMTAGALLDLPTLRRLEVLEISPAVLRAAAEFARWNGGLLDDPRVRVRIVDGRHALAIEERRFELVTADPIHPWTRGSSDLYSREHFRQMEAHLAPGGVASQWLPLYQLGPADVRTVVATWCAAFPRTSAWLAAYDLVLVGSREALPEPAELARRALPERAARALAEIGVHSSAELAALCVADDARLRAFGGDAPLSTDDRPVLEFRAPLAYLAGYSEPALAWAADPAGLPAGLPPAARERGLAVRALLRRFLAELPAGRTRAAERYGAQLCALPALPAD